MPTKQLSWFSLRTVSLPSMLQSTDGERSPRMIDPRSLSCAVFPLYPGHYASVKIVSTYVLYLAFIFIGRESFGYG